MSDTTRIPGFRNVSTTRQAAFITEDGGAKIRRLNARRWEVLPRGGEAFEVTGRDSAIAEARRVSEASVARRGTIRIYAVTWFMDGTAVVRSLTNDDLVGEYEPGVGWDDRGRLPDDVRDYAMMIRPGRSDPGSAVPSVPRNLSPREIERDVSRVRAGSAGEPTGKLQILGISRGRSFADRRVFVVDVQYPGEAVRRVEFTGPSRDIVGPVVMISGGQQTFVDDPSRFGVFGQDWIRRFFA